MELSQNVEVFRSRKRKDAHERQLVLQAMQIRHQLVQGVDATGAQGFAIVVPGEDADRALAELRQWEAENRSWPPAADRPLTLTGGLQASLIYGIVISVLFWLQIDGFLGLDWRGAGRADSTLIREGEIWRCFTALGLHADAVHLLGNLFFGALFGALLCQVVGSGLGWTTILLAGGLGNWLNAWVRGPGHASIGASTAVFGALGALMIWTFVAKSASRARRSRRWAPILAGVFLLSWTGMGGDRTDISGHVTGFLAGLAIGAVNALWLARRPLGPRVQIALSVAAPLLFALGWAVALTTDR